MDAAVRWSERKANAGVEETELREEGVSRLLVSGFDIDYEELLEFKKNIAVGAYEASMTNTLPEVFSGMWVDGLITGILFEQQRQRERSGG